MSFAASIRGNSRKLLLKINSQVYKIAKELFTRIVELTPSPSNPGYDAEGRLANQWYPEVGASFSSRVGTSTSPNGAESLTRISALGMSGAEFYEKDGKLTLTNNVEYAYRAEVLGWPEADGWSGKVGPYRMVAKAIQEIAAKYG